MKLSLFFTAVKTDVERSSAETSMPVKNSVWDTAAIRALVCEWYGVRRMSMRIVSREQEIEEFENTHIEVPPCLWEYVNHTVRIVRMWARPELCLDIVVWDEISQSHRLVQDLVFKDAYPDIVTWYSAIADRVKTSEKVWIVVHDEDDQVRTRCDPECACECGGNLNTQDHT